MTSVKICGITRPADARLAADLGAWALGMVFWPGSPRVCAIDDAEAIGAEFRRRLQLTGVFVNATLDEVAATTDRCGLTLVQLHGDEGPAYCREAARRTGCRVMKAVRVRDAAQVRDLQRFHTDFHLLDAYSPRTPGGTGETFAWELVREHAAASRPGTWGRRSRPLGRSRSIRRAAPRRSPGARTPPS
jgi:phosphoribosylanthranilate isomerase